MKTFERNVRRKQLAGEQQPAAHRHDMHIGLQRKVRSMARCCRLNVSAASEYSDAAETFSRMQLNTNRLLLQSWAGLAQPMPLCLVQIQAPNARA